MRQLRAWMLRAGGLFTFRARERELANELESHLQMHIADNVRAGMSPGEARRRALIALGGLESTKERYRGRSGIPAVRHALRDVRYAARVLRRNPGFTAVAVVTLALGIGVNAGIFTILNAAALRPLPVPDADRLVYLSQSFQGHGLSRNVHGAPSLLAYPEYVAYRDQSHVFSGVLAYAPFITATLAGDHPRNLIGALVSCNYFDVLESRPALGRGLDAADCLAPGAGAVVVLSDQLWRDVFAADPAIVGRTVSLNRTSFIVVGVAPPGFRGTEVVPSEFWAPVTMQTALVRGRRLLADDNMSWLVVLARLKSRMDLAAARADLQVAASGLDIGHPGRTTRMAVDRATLAALPEARAMVFSAGAVILAAVGLVLMIACANIANLLLARAAGRRREIALRLAIGASRGRLIQQLLTESLLLAALGGTLGYGLASWFSASAVTFAVSRLAGGVPVSIDVHPDGRVFAFALVLTTVTGIAFGLVPALQSTRGELIGALKEEGASTGSDRSGPGLWRSALVTVQVAVCMLLLLAAGLLLRGLYRAAAIDPGFRMRDIDVVAFDLSGAGYTQETARDFHDRFIQRLGGLPGVSAVAAAQTIPLSDEHTGDLFTLPDGAEHSSEFNVVSASYLRMLGIPIVSGRDFTATEVRSGAGVAIVTESTARRLWPGRDPLGQSIRWGRSQNLQVIGVARDAQVSHLSRADTPLLYLPAGPRSQLGLRLLVQSAVAHADLMQSIREVARELDPQLPVEVTRLQDNLDSTRAPSDIVTMLAGTLGLLALVLASTGVYGMVAYSVSRRVREIGIRVALGAAGGDVIHLIVRESMKPVAIGIAIGVAACAAVSTILSSLLFGLSPYDPIAFLGVPAALFTVALVACYLPARCVLHVDPMIALRHE